MKILLIHIIYLLFGFLLSSQCLSAPFADASLLQYQENKVLLDSQSVQGLGDKFYYLEDVGDQYSLESVQSLENSAWRKSEASTPNFGYTDSSYWFRVSLESSDISLDKLLAIQYSLLDYIEVYFLKPSLGYCY